MTPFEICATLAGVALTVFGFVMYSRLTTAENRLRYLEYYAGMNKQTAPIPTPQDAASAGEVNTNPFYPHQPQPPLPTVWDGVPWAHRHRPNLPKEDAAGKERDLAEKVKQTREPRPYGVLTGEEPRPIE